MFNLTEMVTYLRASTNTTYRFHQESSGVARKDPPSRNLKLSLIFITAMVFHYIAQYWELKRQDQRQDKRQRRRLAALENSKMDIMGTLMPSRGSPLHSREDDFRLPPPAYELDEVFLAQRAGNAARISV